MPAILWNIYESQQQGMTREVIERFKQRAIADGMSPTTALVRLLTHYAKHGLPDELPLTPRS